MWQPFEWLWAEPGIETAINNFQRYYSLPDLIFFLSFYPSPRLTPSIIQSAARRPRMQKSQLPQPVGMKRQRDVHICANSSCEKRDVKSRQVTTRKRLLDKRRATLCFLLLWVTASHVALSLHDITTFVYVMTVTIMSVTKVLHFDTNCSVKLKCVFPNLHTFL